MNFFDRFDKEHIIIAHRGYRSIRAENTLDAFKEAIGKSDMFEFDVQYTKDFIPVVIHDDTLCRTTNAKSIFKDKVSPYYVKDFTLKEIKELDNSEWFLKSDPFGTIDTGEIDTDTLYSLPNSFISTLDTILEFIKDEDFPANLEIKDSKYFDSEKIAKDISHRMRSADILDSCIVSSFNHAYLKLLKKLDKDIKIAALFEKEERAELLKYLKELDVDAYHIDKSLVKKDKIKLLKDNGIYTNVYTINDSEEKKSLFNEGVKGIFTDKL
ncbi:MAG: glycerophosphodiester phosphodiesterase [Epsilonproteobacteria bacterium]|nr:glycerophosphodiester phosphodiesterase [Campylobacterota bacterium]